MVKTNIFIGFLLFAVAFDSSAHDSDRIDQLENEIQELKIRLSKLESLLSNQNMAQEVVTTSKGWKSIENWRKLAIGMSASDVRTILGEPHRVDGGTLAQWHYQKGGIVIFYEEKVYKWMEPRQ